MPAAIALYSYFFYLGVELFQIHHIIPFVDKLKPGLLSQAAMVVVIAMRIADFSWIKNIAIWKALLLLAIVPGLFVGVTQGLVLRAFTAEATRYVFGFIGACLVIRSLKEVRALYAFILVSTLLLSVFTILKGGKGPGLYKDENDMAMMLVLLLPFAFFKIFDKGSFAAKAGNTGLFAVCLLAIASTLSRGGMVGALPCLFLCLMKVKHKVIAIPVGIAMLGLAVAFGPDKLVSEFKTIGDTEESTAASRIRYWGLSTEMFLERPLFGVGAYCWGNAFYSGVVDNDDFSIHNMTPHSIYFQALSELGLFGTIPFIGLLAAVFAALWKMRASKMEAMRRVLTAEAGTHAVLHRHLGFLSEYKLFAQAAFVGLLGYLLSAGFISVLFYPGLTLMAGLVQALREAYKRDLGGFMALKQALATRDEAAERRAQAPMRDEEIATLSM